MTLGNYAPGSIIQLFWILASLTGLALKANLSYQSVSTNVNNSLQPIILKCFPGLLRSGITDHCVLQFKSQKGQENYRICASMSNNFRKNQGFSNSSTQKGVIPIDIVVEIKYGTATTEY